MDAEVVSILRVSIQRAIFCRSFDQLAHETMVGSNRRHICRCRGSSEILVLPAVVTTVARRLGEEITVDASRCWPPVREGFEAQQRVLTAPRFGDDLVDIAQRTRIFSCVSGAVAVGGQHRNAVGRRRAAVRRRCRR
jgi:hypothetical protein